MQERKMSIPIYMAILLNPGAPADSQKEWETAMNALSGGKSDVILYFHHDGTTTRSFV